MHFAIEGSHWGQWLGLQLIPLGDVARVPRGGDLHERLIEAADAADRYVPHICLKMARCTPVYGSHLVNLLPTPPPPPSFRRALKKEARP